MTLVLDEHEWAEEMIRQNSLGKKPGETLCRVAKYYTDKGFGKADTRKLVEAFLIRCDPAASLPKWSDAIDRAITRSGKYKAIHIDKIVVTQPEMEKIRDLSSVQLRRLAFTLLCLAKYFDIVNPNGDHWVNTPDEDIMRMANINTSVTRQSAMFHTLYELGLVSFSKKVDNTNIRVMFTEDGASAVEITDMRNLGYQYLAAIGDGHFCVCEDCGATVKADKAPHGRKQKYCRECAARRKDRQTIELIRAARDARKC